ncbi:MAG: GldM family protein [Phaeodactylibacter xiamenensis]|uniref:Gliding motility-like protein n=1 Tax=Phaeodactylibacter xiamenensis TaxID=1524460 RepID=A0A098SD34_9BACT|nr:GldM family protein [Phaeodactylibacter xiamenensis]KGE88897.1 hypothetical protein IX84_06215 [Phaeodactylibacter xiamenensis]MCR9054744.1 hypothetical protein [bacterium]
MSIPKDPRQLMINLMYIVLTALLALNVSAEILEAFFTIDRSLGESSAVVQYSNEQMLQAIREEAEAYEQYQPYVAKAEKLGQITGQLQEQLRQVRADIVEAAGGLDQQGIPARETDKDIPTRILINEGHGKALKTAILQARQDLLSLIENEEQRRRLEASIPLSIPALPPDATQPTWEAHTFQQMPVAAVLPILRKFENDAEVAEAAILNYFLSKMGAQIVMDAYEAVVAAPESYIIRGDTYRSEIFLSAYSSTADNIRISVDGQPLRVEGGKATFTTSPSRPGQHEHIARIELEDPVTGTVQRFERPFRFQVGEQAVAVAADKMNVLYAGVDNPVTISAAGIPSATMRVNASGTDLQPLGGSAYIARPDKPGKAVITVSGEGLAPINFEYRVKKIPDPVLEIAQKRGGTLPAGTFRAQQGIIPVLDNFDFQARCEITGFEVVRKPEQADIAVAHNSGARFAGTARRLIDAAEHGDTYYFNEVKVRCPGDTGPARELNSLIFKIR